MTHFIFFDHTCRMCQNAVRRIQELDKERIFEFYPLTSSKAKEMVPTKYLGGDTIVLLENQKKVWIRSKAIFRIFHLLGGKWKWLGALCYIPGLDLFYRAVAHNRYLFNPEK